MWKRMLNPTGRLVLVMIVAVAIFLSGRLQAERAVTSLDAAGAPMVRAQVFDVSCTSVSPISPAYVKLLDLANFTSSSADSMHELTYNGRIYVSSFSAGTGAVFELRVDDAVSTIGRARASLRAAEAGGGGVQVSITGFFTGLAPGSHTASMWVRTSSGGAGTSALVDPGCWSTDVLIVKEHAPLGMTFLPSVQQAAP